MVIINYYYSCHDKVIFGSLYYLILWNDNNNKYNYYVYSLHLREIFNENPNV